MHSISLSSNKLNSTMKILIDSKQYKKALNLFNKQSNESTDFTKNMAIKACTKLRDYQTGFKILEELSPTSRNDPYIQTSSIHLYMQCHKIDHAYNLFLKATNKSDALYSAMFQAGLITNKMPEKVLDLFNEMTTQPGPFAITALFNACAQLSNQRAKTIGKKTLQQLLNNDQSDNILLNSAIFMLMKFGDVKYAEVVFDMMEKKDIYGFGAMIKGYQENQEYEKVLDLYEKMNFKGNNIIHTIVFNTCAELSHDRSKAAGKKLLKMILDNGQYDNLVLNSAIRMLMKFGDVNEAERIFYLIKEKDTYSFSAMIKGYMKNEEHEKALDLYEQMSSESNDVTYTIVFNTCAQLANDRAKKTGKNLLKQILANGDQYDDVLLASATGMLMKFGDVENAEHIFRLIRNKNIITYINAYGLNGMGYEAVELYKRIPNDERDEISHICVLNACSHSGLLDEAHNIFNRIHTKTEKIITTMVDCLSRLFLFDEAQSLIDNYEKMNPPSIIMYMAMLSGARNHRNRQLAEKIYDRMKSVFPGEKQSLLSGAILLSNIYSSFGEYELAMDIRSKQKNELGINIKVGVTWTMANGELVEFKAHDMSHPRSSEIYAELDRLALLLLKHGHTFDSSWITRKLDTYESIQSVLCGHSEKLAIAFNLIQRPIPSTIQITKNLRICGDCQKLMYFLDWDTLLYRSDQPEEFQQLQIKH
ncbi:unnamed protein product [Rotaria sp. Silwood1]|nr:unnamed protein product [Rotaria sp. Silwood1]CAF1658387.1 unnamed protein product [Rotaria sp. Silwood1]